MKTRNLIVVVILFSLSCMMLVGCKKDYFKNLEEIERTEEIDSDVFGVYQLREFQFDYYIYGFGYKTGRGIFNGARPQYPVEFFGSQEHADVFYDFYDKSGTTINFTTKGIKFSGSRFSVLIYSIYKVSNDEEFQFDVNEKNTAIHGFGIFEKYIGRSKVSKVLKTDSNTDEERIIKMTYYGRRWHENPRDYSLISEIVSFTFIFYK